MYSASVTFKFAETVTHTERLSLIGSIADAHPNRVTYAVNCGFKEISSITAWRPDAYEGVLRRLCEEQAAGKLKIIKPES